MNKNYVCYYLQRNVSEKFAQKKPLKEMARCLLAEKSFCGGGANSERKLYYRRRIKPHRL